MQVELLEYFKSQIPFDPLPQNYKDHILKPLMNLANGMFLEVLHNLAIGQIRKL